MRLHVTVELKENIQSENLGGQGWPGSLHSSSQLAVSKAHLTGVSLGYSPLGYSKNMWISRRHNRCNQPPKTAHVLKKRTETRDNHGPPSPVPPTKKNTGRRHLQFFKSHRLHGRAGHPAILLSHIPHPGHLYWRRSSLPGAANRAPRLYSPQICRKVGKIHAIHGMIDETHGTNDFHKAFPN